MEKVVNFIKNYVLFIVIPIMIIELFIVIFLVFKGYPDKEDNYKNTIASVASEKKEEEEENLVKVDIKGAVNKPGVYELESNSIINDVIKKAGGLKKDASTRNINLSKRLENEMVIYVAKKGEFKSITCKDNQVLDIKEESENISLSSNSVRVKDYNNIDANDSLLNNNSSSNNVLVNINSASKEELLKIPNVGSSKADSIIEYRLKKGNFNTIEDIKNVSGIGDNLFDKIKNYITV